MVTGTGAPSRDKLPGCLERVYVESGKFNKRTPSRQPGSLPRKGVLSNLLYQPCVYLYLFIYLFIYLIWLCFIYLFHSSFRFSFN